VKVRRTNISSYRILAWYFFNVLEVIQWEELVFCFLFVNHSIFVCTQWPNDQTPLCITYNETLHLLAIVPCSSHSLDPLELALTLIPHYLYILIFSSNIFLRTGFKDGSPQALVSMFLPRWFVFLLWSLCLKPFLILFLSLANKFSQTPLLLIKVEFGSWALCFSDYSGLSLKIKNQSY